MPYYLGVPPGNNVGNATVWLIEGGNASRIDAKQDVAVVSPPPHLVLEHHPSWKFIPLKLDPGQFYPRMARPTSRAFKESPGLNPQIDPSLVAMGRGQLAALLEQLERVFRVVHPTQQNFESFGHEIRNILILASTEVEAQWKGILKANGGGSSSTNDYVKLLPAMKLDEYAITLAFYPWLEPIRPFSTWRTLQPTQSLRWYNAYNAVKHDRETSFERGTLLNALEAVCAIAVLLYAQFGATGLYGMDAFFELSEAPCWDGSEVYPVCVPGGNFTPIPFPF